MTKRKKIPPPTQKRLLKKNLGVCCVCKERGLGTNFHHIDGVPANNDEDNIAVLCVKEHDQHHRPHAYDQLKHLELGQDKIRQLKQEWEHTVAECNSDNPNIIAVLIAYGDYDNIHSVRLVIQNVDQKIIYQRDYHLLTGTPDQWTDDIIDEVAWLGKNVKLTVISEPSSIEHCSCGSVALSSTLDKNAAIHLTAKDWKEKSIGSIYINPTTPSIAFILSYGDDNIYTASMHKCNGHLHFMCDNFEERTPIRKKPSIRTQASDIMQKVIKTWEPGRLFIGTGDPDKPTIIDDFDLPKIWEKRKQKARTPNKG